MIQFYKLAISVGAVLVAIHFLIYSLTWLWQFAWAWMDDAKVAKNNKYSYWLCMKKGYTPNLGLYSTSNLGRYYTKHDKLADGSGIFMGIAALLLVLPAVCVCLLQFYPVAIGLASVVCLMIVTRFLRRTKKKLDKHITGE